MDYESRINLYKTTREEQGWTLVLIRVPHTDSEFIKWIEENVGTEVGLDDWSLHPNKNDWERWSDKVWIRDRQKAILTRMVWG